MNQLNAGQIDAILFDLDGTLMDTDDQAVERVSRRLERWRWPQPERMARRLIMAAETPGNLVVTALDVFGLDAPLTHLARRARRGAASRPDLRLISGAAEMLAALRGRYRLAIVTTRGRAEAESFIEQHDLDGIFDLLVTRESTWRLKPHPAPIRYAARSLGLPVERCLMVGDTTVDVRSARRAGAWAVAVLCGFGERDELERAGAHVVLEHIVQLPTVLEEGTTRAETGL